MALLVQKKGDDPPVVLAAGSPSECLDAGRKRDSAGEGGLTVWDTRKGIIWHGKGLLPANAKRHAKAAEARERSIALRNAEAQLAAQEIAVQKAQAGAARAQERLEAAEAAAAKAEASVSAAAATPTKKSTKKKAAKEKVESPS